MVLAPSTAVPAPVPRSEAARSLDAIIAIGEALQCPIGATPSEILARAKLVMDLLPVIHRDGGHYVTEHGVAKACVDGEARVLAAYHAQDTVRESFIAEVAAMREHYNRPAGQQTVDEIVRRLRGEEADAVLDDTAFDELTAFLRDNGKAGGE